MFGDVECKFDPSPTCSRIVGSDHWIWHSARPNSRKGICCHLEGRILTNMIVFRPPINYLLWPTQGLAGLNVPFSATRAAGRCRLQKPSKTGPRFDYPAANHVELLGHSRNVHMAWCFSHGLRTENASLARFLPVSARQNARVPFVYPFNTPGSAEHSRPKPRLKPLLG